MIYDIRVRPQVGQTDLFQPYIETVEALTAHDAISMVQRRNPGCLVQCEGSYNEPSESSGIGDIASATGWMILAGFIFAVWFAIEYWYIVIPCAIILVIAMLSVKLTD